MMYISLYEILFHDHMLASQFDILGNYEVNIANFCVIFSEFFEMTYFALLKFKGQIT